MNEGNDTDPANLPVVVSNASFRASEERMPTLVVAAGFSRGRLPFALDCELELRGGGRLGLNGVGCDLALDWHPELMARVEAACADQRVRGRDWFTMPPTLLLGPKGVGRTHVARRLATSAGVPHIVLDVSANTFAATWSPPDVPLPMMPLVGMAMSGCANPVVTVTGLDSADERSRQAVVQLIEAPANGRFVETTVGAVLDLSQVTWLLQSDAPGDLPPRMLIAAPAVHLVHPDDAAAPLFVIDLIAEAAADVGVTELDPFRVELMVKQAAGMVGRIGTREIYDQIASRLRGDPAAEGLHQRMNWRPSDQ